MTEPVPIFVVLGIDGEGKARASRFAERDAELATKAATLLGFRSARIKNEAGCAIAESLPQGNVFAAATALFGSFGSPRSRSSPPLSTEVSPRRQSSGGRVTGKSKRGSARICTLNDQLRRFGRGGRIMITSGIQALARGHAA
jgi:hypothetical protein